MNQNEFVESRKLVAVVGRHGVCRADDIGNVG